MGEKKFIYLIVGVSGSGKTTVTDILVNTYGWKALDSYTTRLPRYKGETGHVFCTKEEFDKIEDKCAYTMFDGHEYCASTKQVDESDIYIIDPAGVDYFLKHYKGEREPVIVMLDISDRDSIINMTKRGDNPESTWRRFKHDQKAFRNMRKRLRKIDLDALCIDIDESVTLEYVALKILEDKKQREVMQ
ncbi:guanylate kinase [Clostridiales Family XIII bacterium PM5-7]